MLLEVRGYLPFFFSNLIGKAKCPTISQHRKEVDQWSASMHIEAPFFCNHPKDVVVSPPLVYKVDLFPHGGRCPAWKNTVNGVRLRTWGRFETRFVREGARTLRPGFTYPFNGHQYLSSEYYNYEMDGVFIRRISVNFIEKRWWCIASNGHRSFVRKSSCTLFRSTYKMEARK